MVKYSPYVTLDPQNCGLAVMHGLGYGNRLNDEVTAGAEWHVENYAKFDRLMVEFGTGTGFFRNRGEGPYRCPVRHAMTLSVNRYQKERWGPKLAEHGWVQVAAFNNLKNTGTGPCFIFFRARKGCEYVGG